LHRQIRQKGARNSISAGKDFYCFLSFSPQFGPETCRLSRLPLGKNPVRGGRADPWPEQNSAIEKHHQVVANPSASRRRIPSRGEFSIDASKIQIRGCSDPTKYFSIQPHLLEQKGTTCEVDPE
jgi:hypothetical protein